MAAGSPWLDRASCPPPPRRAGCSPPPLPPDPGGAGYPAAGRDESEDFATIKKVNPKYDVGLSLVEKNGVMAVAEASRSCLFAKSRIAEGCKVLGINGQHVRAPLAS